MQGSRMGAKRLRSECVNNRYWRIINRSECKHNHLSPREWLKPWIKVPVVRISAPSRRYTRFKAAIDSPTRPINLPALRGQKTQEHDGLETDTEQNNTPRVRALPANEWQRESRTVTCHTRDEQ